MKNLQTIIRGCIANDAMCRKLIYERYYGYALKIGFRYVYQHDRLADMVNNGFIELFRGIGSFVSQPEEDIEPQLKARIKKIVILNATEELRRNNLMPKTSIIPGNTWQTPGANQNANTLLLYKELICHLKSLLPPHAAVYNMYVIDGFSHQEIAEQLCISVDTSKSYLFEAKASLQKLVNKKTVYSNTM